MIAKLEMTHSNAYQNKEQHRTPTNNGRCICIKQQFNNNRTTALQRTLALDPPTPGERGGGGVNAFYWRQIFALDYVVVKTQKLLSSQRNYLIKLTHYDETKKRAHASQIARAKENPKLSYGGPSQGQTN